MGTESFQEQNHTLALGSSLPSLLLSVFCLILFQLASVFQFIALVINFNLYLFFISRVFILFVPTDSQARMVIVIQ